ncbi:MAG: hypothetical protein WCI91_04085 [Candidatus Nomurabacteria bacterium]
MKRDKFSKPISGSFPDKVSTSSGYILSGDALDSTNKYSKVVGPNCVLFVDVDTINKKSFIYSIYAVRYSEKKKSLAVK